MSKIREKESLECRRMHIWALKTQKLPRPLSRPWTPAADSLLHLHNSALLHGQLSASEARGPWPVDSRYGEYFIVMKCNSVSVKFFWKIEKSRKAFRSHRTHKTFDIFGGKCYKLWCMTDFGASIGVCCVFTHWWIQGTQGMCPLSVQVLSCC